VWVCVCVSMPVYICVCVCVCVWVCIIVYVTVCASTRAYIYERVYECIMPCALNIISFLMLESTYSDNYKLSGVYCCGEGQRLQRSNNSKIKVYKGQHCALTDTQVLCTHKQTDKNIHMHKIHTLKTLEFKCS